MDPEVLSTVASLISTFDLALDVPTHSEVYDRLSDGVALEQAAFALYRAKHEREFVSDGATVGIGPELRRVRWSK